MKIKNIAASIISLVTICAPTAALAETTYNFDTYIGKSYVSGVRMDRYDNGVKIYGYINKPKCHNGTTLYGNITASYKSEDNGWFQNYELKNSNERDGYFASYVPYRMSPTGYLEIQDNFYCY